MFAHCFSDVKYITTYVVLLFLASAVCRISQILQFISSALIFVKLGNC